MDNIKNIKEFNELNLKQTLRAHILYEQIIGHPFEVGDGLNGIVVLFYSYIVGSNRQSNVDYNDYLDWLDEHMDMVGKFSEWLQAQNKAVQSMPHPETPVGEAMEAGK